MLYRFLFYIAILVSTFAHIVILQPIMHRVVRGDSEFGFSNTPSGGHFDRQWGLGGWMVDKDHNNDPRKRGMTK